MTEAAKNITNLRTPEQDFEQNQEQEPWLRQKNEPAIWFMRFKRYLDMGSKRGLRALVASESGTQVNTKEGKKLSDVSVPRAWRRASKLWRWVERANCYDLAEQAKEAKLIRKIAGSQEYSSRAYRLLQLNYVAKCIRLIIESWTAVPHDETKDYLAIIARYQSVMRDIEHEMQGIDVADDTIDAAAMCEVSKEIVEQRKRQMF